MLIKKKKSNHPKSIAIAAGLIITAAGLICLTAVYENILKDVMCEESDENDLPDEL